VVASFDDLVAEADAAPIAGWDFGWLDGRASEERPSWHYSELVAERAATATMMLDLQTGGGELLVKLPRLPRFLVGTEAYPPNVGVAARKLHARGAYVVAAPDNRPAVPFASNTFDLVTSRHPITAWWEEIARVIRPGGVYLSQQVGPGSIRELTEFLMGPQPPGSKREPRLARAGAEAAGLTVEDLRSEQLRTEFNDVGAVVYFLRLVVWIVPGFTVDGYRDRLRALHDGIQRDGPFVTYASRFLIEATKPA
jgi:SAM-dependent methyltransferase